MEEKKRLKEEKSKEKGLRPYPMDKKVEVEAWKIISKMNYVTPYLLAQRMGFRLSRGKDVLRKFYHEGKVMLLEKNRDLEIYKPIAK